MGDLWDLPGNRGVEGLGVLDANGKTLEPFFKIPPGVMPPGVNHLDHAFVVIDPVAGSVDLISNTVGLDFVP